MHQVLEERNKHEAILGNGMCGYFMWIPWLYYYISIVDRDCIKTIKYKLQLCFLEFSTFLETSSWDLELICTHLLIMVPFYWIPCCEVVLIMVYLIFKSSVQRRNKHFFSLAPCGEIKWLKGWKNSR